MRKTFALFLAFLFAASLSAAYSAKSTNLNVQPPFWWTGMADSHLQLMLHADGIRDAVPTIVYDGVTIDSVARLDSPNYLFLYLNIAQGTKAGKFKVDLKGKGKSFSFAYELQQRDGTQHSTFDASDVLYLIMPDRFANGDASNDVVKSMRFPAAVDRKNPNARHGGDLIGISQHLGYIDSLGVTTIWLNPVLENDMPDGSYHGYATTDYYRVDPRLGTNIQYRDLISKAHNRGLKVVMDMIFNHCGSEHEWLRDLPSHDWLNFPEGNVTTNFRLSTVSDPYASHHDLDRSIKGWFVKAMPDLNQNNPHLMRYLIQNSIWWIEFSHIDGIRMDTYPYADIKPMAEWLKAVDKEYPGYNVVGECWFSDAASTAFWQKHSRINRICDTGLTTVMDFPTMLLASKAFSSDTGFSGGLNDVYNRLSLDYLYEDPQHVLTFLDNHDSDRFLKSMPTDLGSWKQAITFLLTSRGIPQVYYGTELLMNGNHSKSDGDVRRDVPGGFAGDTNNEFSAAGRSAIQNEAVDFFSRLANWRKTEGNDVIAKGKLVHFMPTNGLYVYQRSYQGKTVTVIMNGNDKPVTADMSIYSEIMPVGFHSVDVLSGKPVSIDASMTFPARAVFVLPSWQ